MRHTANHAADLIKRHIAELCARVAPEIDQQRKRFQLFFVSYVTSWVMLFFAFRSFHHGDAVLSAILLGFIGAFLLNIVMYHLSGDLNRACNAGSFIVIAFVLGLVYHGGHENTALYWLFPFPTLLFGLLGARRGLIVNSSVACCVLALLVWPELTLAEYREAEKYRFMASLVIVIMVSWLNEAGRRHNLESMDELQRQKEILANTDVLTQLPNRRFLDHTLPQHLKAQPSAYFPLALIACDLDHFKQINDQYGHAIGDLALQHVARILASNLRQQDIACRYGGEEFLLLLPHCQPEHCVRIAESLRKLIENAPFQPDPQQPPIPLTGSFGIASCASLDHLQLAIQQADLQMYSAKQAGRNQVCALLA